MNAYITGLIRVGVAAGVGALAAMFARWGMHLPAGWTATIAVAITGSVTTFYLHAVAALENRWPWIGSLLGVRKPGPPSASPAARPSQGKT